VRTREGTRRGRYFEQGKERAGEGIMSIRFASIEEAPNIILNWTSELMRMYPWVMRLSLLLHRLVQ